VSTSIRKLILAGCSIMAMTAAHNWVMAQEQGGQGGQQGGEQGGQRAQQPAEQPAQQPAPQGGQALPQVTVSAPKQAPKARPRRVTTPPRPRVTAPAPVVRGPPPTPEQAQQAANRTVVQQTSNLNERRDDVILPKIGANTHDLTPQDVESIPQGGAAPLKDFLLQFPGVYQDSKSSGDFHIRNDHANVQFRINGILLPDSISGYSQLLDPTFIASMKLIDGALPAQYGLHTVGILDFTTKSGADPAGGSVGVYGGSQETITSSFQYGGVIGKTDYFVTGRFRGTDEGLENPTASYKPIHDQTRQGQLFEYTSTLLDPSTRVVTLAGVSEQKFQIPNNPGQATNAAGFVGGSTCPGVPPGTFTAWCIGNANSAYIDQNQYEKNAFGAVAWQRSVDNLDVQLTYYNRYSDLHFVPDLVGDMLFNDVASDVFRSSFLNGVAGDAAYRLNEEHTLRTGFVTNAEFTSIRTTQTVEFCPGAPNPTIIGPAPGYCPAGSNTAFEPPFNIPDASDKFGWQLGAYIQDEWRLTPKLTLNYGLRFDQIFQYVDANQFSPRAALQYTPWWGTVLHAGYMRYFTPPEQVLGRLEPFQLYENTTNSAATPNVGNIEPERGDVYDVGIVQQVLPRCPEGSTSMLAKAPIATTYCPTLEIGIDAYYKKAKDLIDDGQFGQAYVLTAFNYAKGENWGVEFSGKFKAGNLTVETNWAVANQLATQVASNQSLFDPDELAYIATHWIHTDHDQWITGSGRVAYRVADTHTWWDGTLMSATMIYGSGLRTDFANMSSLPPYWQVNVGVSHDFLPPANWIFDKQPITVRFDVVNVTDNIYFIRNGSGIGVFASQYGPRRGYYVGISQKLGPTGAAPGFATPMPGIFKAQPSQPVLASWAGFYGGAHFGGAFSSGEDETVGPALLGTAMHIKTNPFGALGGIQLGYNYLPMPNWLAGVEGELSWTTGQGKANFFNNVTAADLYSSHKWYDTLTGRFGHVDGPLLLYAKAGGAWMNADYKLQAF
jgi:hypothetical protein